MTGFTKRVLTVVAAIPSGSVMTYGEVAEAAGFPGAARAVGTLMSHNVDPHIPCHRVIRADGTPGEYSLGGRERKVALLKQEGYL